MNMCDSRRKLPYIDRYCECVGHSGHAGPHECHCGADWPNEGMADTVEVRKSDLDLILQCITPDQRHFSVSVADSYTRLNAVLEKDGS